jgi:type IV secretion system protein VirD4
LDGIPLRQDGEIAQAQLVGEMLTDPDSRGADRQSGNSRHFTEMAAEAVAGLTLYGLYTQRARSLAALNALIRQVPFLTLLQQMQRYPHPAIQRVASTLLQTDSRDERSGIFSTLSRTLRLYTDPLIARMTDTSDWTLRDLRERAQPMSLYLTVPFRHLERVRPWTRMVARQCFDHATSRKGGWTWPLLGLMDEFPSLKRMTSLTDGLNTWAGYGVRLMLITPSMEELIDVYGIHHHFYEGCKVQIIFGMYDPKVADTFSARVGQTEVKRQRPIGRGQWVTERVKEPLCSPTMLMNLPDQQSLVIVGKHKVLAQKTYYKDNPVWLERSLL